MAIIIDEVGAEARAIFKDVRSIGKRVLERFYEGFGLALKDVHRDWEGLHAPEKKLVFERVYDVAKDHIVDKEDGGGADDGLALRTFERYVGKVKLALLYKVPIHIAERAKTSELQKARRRVMDGGVRKEDVDEEKMLVAYKWVKEEQVKDKEWLKEEAAAAKKTSAELKTTPFTLPDPKYYRDEDSGKLLLSGIKSMLAWLETKSLQPHLDKNIKSAKVLKRVLGELTAFENQQGKTNDKKAVAVA